MMFWTGAWEDLEESTPYLASASDILGSSTSRSKGTRIDESSIGVKDDVTPERRSTGTGRYRADV